MIRVLVIALRTFVVVTVLFALVPSNDRSPFNQDCDVYRWTNGHAIEAYCRVDGWYWHCTSDGYSCTKLNRVTP